VTNRAKCTTCGAGLKVKQGDKTCVCEYCQTTNIVENALALGKVEVDVTEDIKKLRANLTTFVQQNSIDEILRVSQKLLDWIPQDFVALYFFAYSKQQQNQPRFMYDFYQSPPTYTKDEWLMVFDHIKIHSELRDRQRVLSLLANENESFRKEYEDKYKIRERMEENYANIPRDVFICFSSYNQSIAQEVLETLERDGHSCWISTRNLRPNDADNYWINIENAIQKASLFIVISSEEAMISKDVQQEVELAIKHHKKRFEIKIDSSKHTSLFKYAFDGVKWVDYQGLNRTKSLTERVFTELSNTKGLIKPQQESKDNFVPAQSKKRASTKPLLYLFGGLLIVALVTALIFNPFEFESSEFTPPENEIVIDISTEDEIVTEETTPIVVIDTTPPELTLIGESLITLAFGEQFSEPGAIAIDDIDGEVDVVISGSVNPDVPGEYRITYTARDATGNESIVIRSIIIEELVERVINVFAGGNNSYAITNANRVFAWGKNIFGTVGDGTLVLKTEPTEITENFNIGNEDYLSIGLKQIQSREQFAVALFKDGSTLIWGRDIIPDGSPNFPTHYKPTPLRILNDDRELYLFKTIAIGDIFSPFGGRFSRFSGLTTDNKLVTNESRIGWVEYDPAIMRDFNGELVAVTMNEVTGYVLTKDGDIYSWGGTKLPRMTLGGPEPSVTFNHSKLPEPGLVIDDFYNVLTDETLVSLASGRNFATAITSNGRGIIFGYNTCGEIYSEKLEQILPTSINQRIFLAPDETIKIISPGENFVILVTSNNRVISWGCNKNNETGIDTTLSPVLIPVEITNRFNFMENESILSVASGQSHSILLTNAGRVFAWGSNIFGQLGEGTTNEFASPLEITNRFLTSENG
jgi:alpha-tubulin suppressor-like RCC1 family protein